MKKWDGLVGMTLSITCATSFWLGVFVCQSQAATDEMWLAPQGNTSGELIWDTGYVAQSFIATIDTIKSASYFCGKERPTGNYTGYINTSPSPGGTGVTGSSTGKKYQDILFNFNIPVIRGKKYYFVVQHSGLGSPQGLEYYCREGDAYLHGALYVSGGQDTSKDLACRITGVDCIPSGYFGVHAFSVWNFNNGEKDKIQTYADSMKSMKVKIDREPIYWDSVQTQSGDHFNWQALDSVISANARDTVSTMICLAMYARWAVAFDPSKHAYPHDDTCYNQQHYTNAYPPRNLHLDVFDQWGNPNQNNYLGYFLWRVAQRYKPNSSFWTGRNYLPVSYDIGNEVNFFMGWVYRDSGFYSQDVYDSTKAANPGWKARANLYEKMAEVGWKAIRDIGGITGGDTTARILACATGGVMENDGLNPSGQTWADYFYQQGGGNYCHGISFHPYQLPFWDGSIRYHFFPTRFFNNVDSMRAVQLRRGYPEQLCWADEVGWPAMKSTDPSPWDTFNITGQKQADILAKLFITGVGGRPYGSVDAIMWFSLVGGTTAYQDTARTWKWTGYAGLMTDGWRSPATTSKRSYYAYRQMTQKLKGLIFNRRLPLPDANMYCYEFQTPDTGIAAKKTWVAWRADSLPGDSVRVPVRSEYIDTTKIAYQTYPDSIVVHVGGLGGFAVLPRDSAPFYIHEYGTPSRPDVIVDSMWLVKASGTGDPKAGDGVRFYARIKNVGNAALSGTVADSVTFQVDGVSKKTYGATRGLGTDTLTDTLTVGYTGFGPPTDWVATWGDHLIRAWADSADRYVELREDNNTKYLWKHFQPKVSVIINNESTFTNHLANNKLHIEMDGNTTPPPDSAKLKHEGTWTRLGVAGSRDTFVTYSGAGVKYDSVKVFQGGDNASGRDSIIVDITAPYAHISSPVQNQWVSGTVPFKGNANDWYEHHLSYWGIRKDPTGDWCSGTNEVGTLYPVQVAGTFGNWKSTDWPNGYYWHWLMVNDSAGNTGRDSVRVYVNNNQTDGGSNWASGFGTYPSATMNVATDLGGNVYIAETQNSKVRKYSPRKDSLFAFSAKRGNDSTGLNWAVSMAMKDSTTLYVADGYCHAIKAFDIQGNMLLRFGSFGTNAGQFRQPCGIALDHKGRLFVVDRGNNRVQVFSDSTGGFLFQFGSQGRDSGKMDSPTGIAIAPNGLVYISDTRNDQLQVFDSLGHYLKTIKAVDSLGLDTPLGICSDRYGDIFISDAGHHRIVELNPYGDRILDFGGLGDSLWQFRTPVGVASSPGAQYLYVADAGNRRVTRFWVIQGDSTGGGGPQSGAGVQVLPMVYELGPAIPNPSRGQTTFRYALPKESQVNFTIYNVAGQVVREFNQGKQKAGYYSLIWDGRSNLGHRVGAGVYFYRLTADPETSSGQGWVKTRKMIVLR